jgi:hypothetical protein
MGRRFRVRASFDSLGSVQRREAALAQPASLIGVFVPSD